MKELRNIELKYFTTLHIGGICKHVYFPTSEKEIRFVLSLGEIIILGCGSNVLINDEIEYEKAMILHDFNHIYRDGNRIIAQSGARLMDVCIFAYEQGLGGLEFAYGIPGSVGGAILMNA
ncbi:MAG: FAD-binding protein, partial [Traorella sp.]